MCIGVHIGRRRSASCPRHMQHIEAQEGFRDFVACYTAARGTLYDDWSDAARDRAAWQGVGAALAAIMMSTLTATSATAHTTRPMAETADAKARHVLTAMRLCQVSCFRGRAHRAIRFRKGNSGAPLPSEVLRAAGPRSRIDLTRCCWASSAPQLPRRSLRGRGLAGLKFGISSADAETHGRGRCGVLRIFTAGGHLRSSSCSQPGCEVDCAGILS